MSYTHLSLFSGIGGLDLAAEQAGFTTVGQCEFADYPTKVLEKHWPDVARWRDIRDLTGEDFYARTGLRTVDVISGGFPCQPFSVAGKQKGKDDDRYLWPEMLRVIRELAPRCVVGENVPGIIRIAAGQVVKDLEQAGYHVVVFNFEAAAVGALHRRERVAFVGYRNTDSVENSGGGRCSKQRVLSKLTGRAESVRASETVAYAGNERLQGREQHGEHPTVAGRGEKRISGTAAECGGESGAFCDTAIQRLQDRTGKPLGGPEKEQQSKRSNWWAVEPDVGRVAHGVPDRVDRLKCLGNAVVPQQFCPIFLALMQELKREDGT